MKAKGARTVLLTALVLLIPVVAMQFTPDVKWTMSDFVVAGILLLGFGFAYELLIDKARTTKQRIGISIVLALLFVYVWAELAVGIFTNWGS